MSRTRFRVNPQSIVAWMSRTSCTKQSRNLKFKWIQRDTDTTPLYSEMITTPLSQTSQMSKLCCHYLLVRCIWLCFMILSRASFKVNPHSIIAWMSRTPSFKQAWNLKFKWLQRESNTAPLNSRTITQPLSQAGQIIQLCCEYLSVWCIWLCIIIMWRTSFRVNPDSIVDSMSRTSF